MHRAAFLFFGINGTYDLRDLTPDRLRAGVAELAADGFAGFNATIPHKEALYELAQAQGKTSVEARLVGAANTVRFDSAGTMHAHNTDMGGFRRALSYHLNSLDLKKSTGGPAVLIGAGGAARACIAGLALSSYSPIIVVSRRFEQAQMICNEVSQALSNQFDFSDLAHISNAKIFALDLAKIININIDIDVNLSDNLSEDGAATYVGANLIVNCTPIGLGDSGEIPPWIEKIFRAASPEALLFDTVYSRDLKPTALMDLAMQGACCDARGSSMRAVDGLRMLVEQAVLGFEYWTGRRPPAELLMDAAVNAALNYQTSP